ncbi:MAG: tetratricopeptide repeat protein [Candidatus Acidiferrales bacterium]
MTTLLQTEPLSKPTGDYPVAPQAAPNPSAPWIYSPWLDLLVGCGAWSAPLLGVAMLMSPTHTHGWVVAFYALATVFNYPHFMATIYRAYHTRENFEKYKFFTLHITLLLALTAILMHASPRLFPWVFTLYICWSPWHYSGQNYGLLMMFARRSGAEISPTERRWLRAAFVASYLMLLASFETGGSNDPLILSLGLPSKFTFPARLALGAAFAVFTCLGFERMVRKHGIRAMIAPITLAITQFLWFVLPTLLELHSAYQVPQTRYSSGILAVLHATQYIWITSYYQRREARAAGQSNWRMWAYFTTLVAGGIALFIPGPWLVSYLFHYDFTTSFLIFMAVVNIHHFILDGALWKLRDSRVASLLVDRGGKSGLPGQPQPTPQKTSLRKARAANWFGSRIFAAPAFAIGVAALLFLWGGMDQLHFALSNDDENLSSLRRASDMNPYDSALKARIAAAESKAGQRDEAVASLQQAVALSPQNAALQHAYARALIEDGRFSDAYAHYQKMLQTFPRDVDALVNYGLLAARLGDPDQAIDSWEKAVDINPNQTNPQLYLAEAFDRRAEPAAAARHWEIFLRLASSQSDSPPISANQLISASIQLADDQSAINQSDAALARYQSAIALAEHANDAKLESLALAHLADLQDERNSTAAAAQSYQRALSLDAQSADPRSEGFDWFNYGQFLRRHQAPSDLVYACLLRAENLLQTSDPAQLQTVQTARREVAAHLGKKVPAAQKDLPALLARAANLPAGSL